MSISFDQARQKGRRVRYITLSGQRPWVSRGKDHKLTGQVSSTSALISYIDEDGDRSEAWVGFAALDLINNAHQGTIDTLTEKRDELQKQIEGINTAIKALEDLG